MGEHVKQAPLQENITSVYTHTHCLIKRRVSELQGSWPLRVKVPADVKMTIDTYECVCLIPKNSLFWEH